MVFSFVICSFCDLIFLKVSALSWDRAGLSVLSNGFLLASTKVALPNWHRVAAWKACEMLKANPQLLVALRKQIANAKGEKEADENEQGVQPMETGE